MDLNSICGVGLTIAKSHFPVLSEKRRWPRFSPLCTPRSPEA